MKHSTNRPPHPHRPSLDLFRRFLGAVIHALLLLVLLAILPSRAISASPPSLLLATTTSVRDSGLLDTLIPEFTKQTGIHVRVIAVGTGAALRMGREGNADILLTHAPASEEQMVEEGFVRQRIPFMENFFVIAGPPDDPAEISNAATPEQAIQSIADKKSGWVSRADDSGTHKREVSLWKAAGLSPDATWPGVIRTGTGMGLSLQVAGEKRAYILSDIGTFLAFEKRIDLQILSKPSDTLRNVYSILLLDSSRFDHALHDKEAEAFAAYLVSQDVLRKIGAFGQERYGRPLFTPIPTAHLDAGSNGARPNE